MKKTTLALALFAFLAACGTSKPTTFYQLSSTPDKSAKITDTRNIFVGVDTVSVAGYLERPQIVTLKNDTELDMSEYNRWAEPLSHSIQRVVAENISKHLKNGMAKPLSIKQQTYDYIVMIELNKFDGKFGDKAKLDAWWTISGKDSKAPLIREHTSLEAPLGNDYQGLVEKQNQLLDQLSTEIVKKLKK